MNVANKGIINFYLNKFACLDMNAYSQMCIKLENKKLP